MSDNVFSVLFLLFNVAFVLFAFGIEKKSTENVTYKIGYYSGFIIFNTLLCSLFDRPRFSLFESVDNARWLSESALPMFCAFFIIAALLAATGKLIYQLTTIYWRFSLLYFLAFFWILIIAMIFAVGLTGS